MGRQEVVLEDGYSLSGEALMKLFEQMSPAERKRPVYFLTEEHDDVIGGRINSVEISDLFLCVMSAPPSGEKMDGVFAKVPIIKLTNKGGG